MKKLLSILFVSTTLLFAQSQEDQAKQIVADQAAQFQQKIQQAKQAVASMDFHQTNKTKIKWVKDFTIAMQLAKKEHKPILFIASKHGCKYCVKLKETTLQNNEVIQKINSDFIALNLYLDEPTSLVPYVVGAYTEGFPTIWFLDPNAKALFQPIGGYIDAQNMKKALDMVAQVYKEAQLKGQ